MKITLSKYEVTIKDELGWYDNQEIQSVMIDGSKVGTAVADGMTLNGQGLLKGKMKLLECAITEIKEGDKTIPFSEAWLRGLNNTDGQKLDEAVGKLNSKKS